MSLHYLGKVNPENCISSVILCLKNDTALACYIFDSYQPILIILAGNSYGVCTSISLISLFNFSCLFAITFLICYEIVKVQMDSFLKSPFVCKHVDY